MKKIKSTLQVFNQSGVPEVPGVIKGIMLKKLTGCPEHPSERINVGIATFAPGTHEHLHWHLIETFHYVLAGAATVRDIEGHVYEVGPGDSGLASGVVNTSFMLGGALGLAVLASIAGARSATLAAAGADPLTALAGGYGAAFLVGAGFATLAALLGGLVLPRSATPATGGHA